MDVGNDDVTTVKVSTFPNDQGDLNSPSHRSCIYDFDTFVCCLSRHVLHQGKGCSLKKVFAKGVEEA